MTEAYHLAVWIDHQTARLYRVKRDAAEQIAVLRARNRGRGNIHHKAGTPGPGHEEIQPEFLARVAESLEEARRILILGPSQAKYALKAFLEANAPIQGTRLVGVEPMASVSPAGILALAGPLFRHADRMDASAP